MTTIRYTKRYIIYIHMIIIAFSNFCISVLIITFQSTLRHLQNVPENVMFWTVQHQEVRTNVLNATQLIVLVPFPTRVIAYHCSVGYKFSFCESCMFYLHSKLICRLLFSQLYKPFKYEHQYNTYMKTTGTQVQQTRETATYRTVFATYHFSTKLI